MGIKRNAIIEGEIAKIPLGVNAKDGYAIVDKEFYYLSERLWSLGYTGYPQINVNKTMWKLHRSVLGKPPKGLVTDHINRNKLDNRKCNLRHVTAKENSRNRGLFSHNTSGHTGVIKKLDKRGAQIKVNQKMIWLGLYSTKQEAIKARLNAETQYFTL